MIAFGSGTTDKDRLSIFSRPPVDWLASKEMRNSSTDTPLRFTLVTVVYESFVADVVITDLEITPRSQEEAVESASAAEKVPWKEEQPPS